VVSQPRLHRLICYLVVESPIAVIHNHQQVQIRLAVTIAARPGAEQNHSKHALAKERPQPGQIVRNRRAL